MKSNLWSDFAYLIIISFFVFIISFMVSGLIFAIRLNWFDTANTSSEPRVIIADRPVINTTLEAEFRQANVELESVRKYLSGVELENRELKQEVRRLIGKAK